MVSTEPTGFRFSAYSVLKISAKIYYKNKMKFFRQLMNWLDSWDEWLNPITLRELRCATRNFEFEFVLIFFYFLAIISYAVLLYLLCMPELKQNLFLDTQTFMSCVIGTFPIVMCFFVSFSTFIPIIRSRRIDELLRIVPLSPQRQVHGCWAFACIQSIFLHSIFLPFIAIGQLINRTSYVLLLILLGSFLFSQIATLVFLSFSARIKQGWELAVLLYTVFGFHPGLIVIIWRYVILLVDQWQLFAKNYGFFFVSLFILLSVMLLLHGYIAYKLSVYGFKTWRKSFWRSLLLNMIVYTLFHLTAATIWVAIAIAVFYL
jgi:hypothetical protein